MAAKKRQTKKQGPNGGRDSKGKFTIGNIGGPGNPHYRRVAAFRRMVSEAVSPEQMAEVIDRMRLIAMGEATREDDTGKGPVSLAPSFADQIAAAKVWLERVMGKPKDMPLAVELPEVSGPKDLPRAALAVLQAISYGGLTAAEGSAVTGALKDYRETFAMTELLERLERLEAKDG